MPAILIGTEYHKALARLASLLICFNSVLTNVIVEFIEFTFIAHLMGTET
jgi:hypothetical protein